MADQFKLCSTCRKPIPFGASYYQCSVSTCQRAKTALFFCSVECWDAHLPMMRHREAWAERVKAPSQAAFLAGERDEDEREARAKERQAMTEDKQRRIVGSPSEPAEKDI